MYIYLYLFIYYTHIYAHKNLNSLKLSQAALWLSGCSGTQRASMKWRLSAPVSGAMIVKGRGKHLNVQIYIYIDRDMNIDIDV